MKRKEWIAGLSVLSVLFFVLMARNRFSFSWSDESLYMAEVHRLYLGDKPFVDEWHPTQFFSTLLLPLYQTYVALNGGTEGIYLWVRDFYIILLFFLAMFVWYVLRTRRRMNFGLSVSAGILVMLYSRANVGGVSYHNLFFVFSVLSIILTECIIGDIEEKIFGRKQKIYSFFVGILTGMAIITIPTLLLPLGILYIFLSFILKRRSNRCYFSVMFCISAGIIGVGVAYLLFLFSRLSFVELINNVKYIFMDPVHSPRTFLKHLCGFGELIYAYGRGLLIILLICLSINIYLQIKGIRMPYQISNWIYIVSAIVCIYHLYYDSDSHMGSYATFGLWGIICSIIFYKEIDLKKNTLWYGCIISSIIILITLSIACATNDPMCQGFVILSFTTLMVISEMSEKNIFGRKNLAYIGSLVTVVMLVVTIYMRIGSVYRDAPLEVLDTMLLKGPAKGLITTEKHAQQYNDCMEVMCYINSLENDDDATVWISNLAPWMYVCTDVSNGAPSPWRYAVNDPLVKLYYDEHDMVNLKYILILKEEYGEYEMAKNVEGTNLKPNENMADGEIWLEMQKNYFMVEFKCGDLYIRRSGQEE